MSLDPNEVYAVRYAGTLLLEWVPFAKPCLTILDENAALRT